MDAFWTTSTTPSKPAWPKIRPHVPRARLWQPTRHPARPAPFEVDQGFGYALSGKLPREAVYQQL